MQIITLGVDNCRQWGDWVEVSTTIDSFGDCTQFRQRTCEDRPLCTEDVCTQTESISCECKFHKSLSFKNSFHFTNYNSFLIIKAKCHPGVHRILTKMIPADTTERAEKISLKNLSVLDVVSCCLIFTSVNGFIFKLTFSLLQAGLFANHSGVNGHTPVIRILHLPAFATAHA